MNKDNLPESNEQPVKRGRGRPPGSKNKSKSKKQVQAPVDDSSLYEQEGEDSDDWSNVPA